MFYIKVGLRNIIKNFRRSFITMISIIIGMTACLLTHGFFNWNVNQLRESMIHSGTGHYQLYRKGFSKYGSDDPFRYLIRDLAPVLKELKEMPGVELVTTRMAFSGILSSGEKSAVVTGESGIPDNERKLNFYSGLIGGTNLSSSKPNGLILGDGVVRKLSAKTGDTLTLMGNMKGGGINAADFELIGITHTGYADLDNMSATASLDAIQSLLSINQSVQKIVVLLKDTRDTQRILPEIERISKKYNLEFKSWESLAEFYQSVKLMYDVVFYIIILIVLAIVTFTISNTVNMNLYDRVREIGTIRALGTKRSQVARIFIAESSLIGILGGVFGLGVSYLFIAFTEFIGGVPITIYEGEKAVIMNVFFRPDIAAVGICIVLFTVVAMAASINPSRRASKISITEALRWI